MTTAVLGSSTIWVGIVLAVLGAVTGKRRWLGLAALAVAVATANLGVALLIGDFSLEYVAETTSILTPWPYRVAALWGGMEGSMLFYTGLSLIFSTIGLTTRTQVRVGAIVGLGLALVTLGFADPFVVSDLPPVDGDGLLAILQHPAMIYHPPILYLGLVLLVVPFGRCVGMVLAGEDRNAWLHSTRRWAYVSWTLLTLGMAFGAHWAYVELGWGGYWAWDPVENTALMPWLAITAFLHASRVEAATGRMRRCSVVLGSVPFALSVLGVYLTRSGVTGSIHSFAEDPVVGRVLIAAALVTLVVTGLLGWRSEPGGPWGALRLDTYSWLATNTVLLAAALVFVTAGTLYPAVTSVFASETVVIDSRYFAATMLPLSILIAIGTCLSLGIGIVRYVLVMASALIGSVVIFGFGPGSLLVATAVATVALVGLALALQRPRGRRRVASVAHLGVAVLLLGIAGSSFGTDFSGSMLPGDTVEVGGHEITLEAVETGEEERYLFVRAEVTVDGAELTPEIRAYEDQAVPVAEPALRSTPRVDVIVAVSLLFPDGQTVAISVFVRPLVWLVWLGALLAALAGLIALFGSGGVGAKPRRSATTTRQRGGTTTDTASL